MTAPEVVTKLRREAESNHILADRYRHDPELQAQYDSAGRAFRQAADLVERELV